MQTALHEDNGLKGMPRETRQDSAVLEQALLRSHGINEARANSHAQFALQTQRHQWKQQSDRSGRRTRNSPTGSASEPKCSAIMLRSCEAEKLPAPQVTVGTLTTPFSKDPRLSKTAGGRYQYASFTQNDYQAMPRHQSNVGSLSSSAGEKNSAHTSNAASIVNIALLDALSTNFTLLAFDKGSLDPEV